MSILIDILLDTVRKEFKKPAPPWQSIPLEPTDLQFLDRECNQVSEFDPKNKRQTMYQNLVKGKAPVVIARCPYGQVTVVLENPDQRGDIPWALWGRILRLYSESEKKKGSDPSFKVFVLASQSLRRFPPGNQPITPENINGGYTYRCNKETILIYRAEDATRVLLHELQHSCCLDHPEQGLDQVEAETEAWAELLWVALLSEGDTTRFHELLLRQSTWVVNQNDEVTKHMKTKASSKGPIISGSVGEEPFPWRYTLGKEEVWRRWGLLSCDNEGVSTTNSSSSSHAASLLSGESGKAEDKRSRKNDDKKQNTANPRKSLRLTFPVDAALTRRFQVKESSTML